MFECTIIDPMPFVHHKIFNLQLLNVLFMESQRKVWYGKGVTSAHNEVVGRSVKEQGIQTVKVCTSEEKCFLVLLECERGCDGANICRDFVENP